MAWMENVQVLDLTTGRPEINIDETSQDTNFGTNSPNSTQEVDTTGETDDDMPYMEKGVGFPIHLFSDMEPEEVDKVPGEINHKCWYRMKSTMKDYLEKSSDRRHFLMRTSSKKSLVGKRKTGYCQGSFVCENKKCSFLSTEGKKKDKMFNFLFKNRTCRACGMFASQTKCTAIKMIQINQLEGILDVYHLGEHTCTPKEDRKKNDDFILEQIQKFPNLPPKQLQVHCIKQK